MTQEEKARAYDEALERARKMMNSKRSVVIGKQALETIFPELRESEDERIRKILVDYFASYKIGNVTTKLNGVRIDDILTYLEKQKDASKAIEAVDRIDKYIDEHLANAHDMKDSNPDKKYYRGWDDALGKMAGILQDVYSNEKQKEQKPAEWSEEDRDRVAQYLHDRDGGMLWSKATEITSDILDILRPRPSWKPSEDEERLINTSISFLKDFADKGYENAMECIDWLKSKLNGTSTDAK